LEKKTGTMKTIAYKPISEDIIEFVKKKKSIVYGGQAQNINLPPVMRKYTSDVDIWDRSFKKRAYELVEELSSKRPGQYKVERKVLPTGKSVYRVRQALTGQVIADVSRAPSKREYYSKDETQFQTLLSQKERLEEIISNPAKKFRHEKARRDLNRINYFLRKMEK